MTPWVARLITANAAMALVEWYLLPGLRGVLAFRPALALVQPWTAVTYMFLHADLGHLFFNMLALYFFGPQLEARLGGTRFLRLYLLSGVAGAILSLVFVPLGQAFIPIVGASGAVYGVQLGFARHWPRVPIYIWGIAPIEARWLIVFMTLLSLYGGFTGAGGNVAHFAHLGGFLGGWLYLRRLERRRVVRAVASAGGPARRDGRNERAALERWSRIRREELHEVNRAEVDRLMEKISTRGVGSLTPGERDLLDRFSTL